MSGNRMDRAKAVTHEALTEAVGIDHAIFDAVARTETPTLDRLLVTLSNAANNSRLWFATAGAVALVGGPRGRRAAAEAVASIGLASAVSNIALKSLSRRSRPGTAEADVTASRRVRRPTSPSFPSGHAASAFAFASTLGEEVPGTWMPVHVAASLVAYARVHTGVHYPADVGAGALIGAMCGWTVRRLAARVAPVTTGTGSADVGSG